MCTLVCTPEYREAQLSFIVVVHGWGLLHQRGDILTATTAVFGQMQSLMLHLFNATNTALWSTFRLALCMIFWLGQLVVLMAQCTALLGVSGGKATRNAVENPISTMGLQLTWHVRPENISLPLTTIARLDWASLWLGLPGYWTSHQWTSSYWATLKPWFICHQLILNRILLSVSLRQQQSGIFECMRQSLLHYCQLCIKVGGHMFRPLF